MNARLKQLIAQRGYDLEKIAALVNLYEGDEAFVEQILLQRVKSHDDQHLLKAAYKAAPAADAGDEYPAELLDALEDAYEALGDWAPITAALQKLAKPVKARVLTDSGRQSAMPAAQKAYNPARDLFAIAVGADQVGRARPATKAAPPTLAQWINSGLDSLGDLH